MMSRTSVMMNAPAGMVTSIGCSGWFAMAALLFTGRPPLSVPGCTALGRHCDGREHDGRAVPGRGRRRQAGGVQDPFYGRIGPAMPPPRRWPADLRGARAAPPPPPPPALDA